MQLVDVTRESKEKITSNFGDTDNAHKRVKCVAMSQFVADVVVLTLDIGLI